MVPRPRISAAVLSLLCLTGSTRVSASPAGLADPARGGVLLAYAQDEPGGFRLEGPTELGEDTAPKETPPPGETAAPPPPAPRPTGQPPPSALEAASPPRKDPLPGYLSLGLGLAFGLVGSIFAANTVAAVDDFPSLKRGQVVNSAFEDELKNAQTAVLVNGLATSILLSACVSSIIAGTLYLVTD